jgi:hypothetical protein
VGPPQVEIAVRRHPPRPTDASALAASHTMTRQHQIFMLIRPADFAYCPLRSPDNFGNWAGQGVEIGPHHRHVITPSPSVPYGQRCDAFSRWLSIGVRESPDSVPRRGYTPEPRVAGNAAQPRLAAHPGFPAPKPVRRRRSTRARVTPKPLCNALGVIASERTVSQGGALPRCGFADPGLRNVTLSA